MRRIAPSLSACTTILLMTLPLTARQDPQKPTFRTGVNLVRVDAYPSRDGKIILGLTAIGTLAPAEARIERRVVVIRISPALVLDRRELPPACWEDHSGLLLNQMI